MVTENLEYCVEQGKNNVGGYREMAYAELKETISNELQNLLWEMLHQKRQQTRLKQLPRHRKDKFY